METRIQELIAEGVPLQYAMRIYQAEEAGKEAGMEAGKEAISISHELIHLAVTLLFNRGRWEEHAAMLQLLVRLNDAAMRLYPTIVLPIPKVEHQHGGEASPQARPCDTSEAFLGGRRGILECSTCWLCSQRAAGSQADSDLLWTAVPRATCWQRSFPTGTGTGTIGGSNSFPNEFVEVVLDMNCALAFAQ